MTLKKLAIYAGTKMGLDPDSIHFLVLFAQENASVEKQIKFLLPANHHYGKSDKVLNDTQKGLSKES